MTTISNSRSFDALIGVAKVDLPYAKKQFAKKYLFPAIVARYGGMIPLNKWIIELHTRKIVCNAYGVSKIGHMTKKQKSHFNTLFPMFATEEVCF
jgi:hypothetical protein